MRGLLAEAVAVTVALYHATRVCDKHDTARMYEAYLSKVDDIEAWLTRVFKWIM